MLVPKLRFQEFSKEWKKCKLNAICQRVIQKNKNNESNLVLTISAQYGLVDQITFFNKNVSSSNLTGYYLLKKGDFAYNKSYSKGYPWGAIKKLNKYENGVVSSLYICFNCNANINDNFLEHYFETDKWYKELSEISVEGARNHGLLNIPVSEFFNTKHIIPSIEEQNKIANILNLIDRKIELQSNKIEALKLYKKGLSNNIFSNKKTNEIFNNIIKYGKSGGTPKSTRKDFYDGNINFLSISDMTNQGKYLNTTEKKISELGLKNSSTWVVPKNSLIVSMYASYGLVSINKIELATSQAMYNMILNEKVDIEYVYQYLEFLKANHYYDTIVSTGTQSNLNAEKIKNIPIYIPNVDEQNIISSTLYSLDKKIDFEILKFNYIKRIKKGLMQNMFV